MLDHFAGKLTRVDAEQGFDAVYSEVVAAIAVEQPPTAATATATATTLPVADEEAWSEDEEPAAAPAADITVQISPAIAIDPAAGTGAGTTAPVMVRVDVPPLEGGIAARPPVDVCCVVDVSGSMGATASCVDTPTELNGIGSSSCRQA